MGINQIEYAAQMFFRMCREHPEVCPHDYSWTGSTIDKTNGVEIKRYICGLCGREMKEKIELSE